MKTVGRGEGGAKPHLPPIKAGASPPPRFSRHFWKLILTIVQLIMSATTPCAVRRALFALDAAIELQGVFSNDTEAMLREMAESNDDIAYWFDETRYNAHQTLFWLRATSVSLVTERFVFERAVRLARTAPTKDVFLYAAQRGHEVAIHWLETIVELYGLYVVYAVLSEAVYHDQTRIIEIMILWPILVENTTTVQEILTRACVRSITRDVLYSIQF